VCGPSAADWQERYVHMPNDHQGDEKLENQSYSFPFDNGTENSQDSTTLGFNFSAIWTATRATGATKSIQDQYRSSHDYQGAY